MFNNSYQTQRAAIENYFKSVWNDTTIILWENTRQTPPNSTYVHVSTTNGLAQATSLGTTQIHKSVGIFTVQLFVKKGAGLGEAYNLADIIVNAFSHKQLDSIQFQIPNITEVGEIDEFYQLNVSCPFYRNRLFIQNS